MQPKVQKHLALVVAIIMAGLVLSILVLVPFIQRQIRSLSTSERLQILLRPERTGTYSVWLPVLLGSPFADPGNLVLVGVTASLIQDSNGIFLNVTATRPTTIWGESSFQGSLNESYLDYGWSTSVVDPLDDMGLRVETRAFSPGNVTVIILYRASSDFCSRDDTLAGTLAGDGAWGTLAGTVLASCT